MMHMHCPLPPSLLLAANSTDHYCLHVYIRRRIESYTPCIGYSCTVKGTRGESSSLVRAQFVVVNHETDHVKRFVSFAQGRIHDLNLRGQVERRSGRNGGAAGPRIWGSSIKTFPILIFWGLEMRILVHF